MNQGAIIPRTRKIVLDGYAVDVDIGFLDFEVGTPQRVLVGIEVWLDKDHFDIKDEEEGAWNYDFLASSVRSLAGDRRYNLQETLARAIFDRVVAQEGVTAVRVTVRKPDIYPNCVGVGVELASF